jgi:hypothetical protein
MKFLSQAIGLECTPRLVRVIMVLNEGAQELVDRFRGPRLPDLIPPSGYTRYA